MSQRNPGDVQKGFAVGQGLLAAAETLNFSSAPQNQAMRGGEIQDRGSQLPRRSSGGSHIGNTMKLFASLGLSPADLDALAQIPEEDISVDTLPDILMQLKRRKGGGGMAGVSSMGMSQQRAPQPSPASDFGYGSMSSVSSSAAHSYDLDYNTRERSAYSELARDSYGGMGMASSSESVFMQRRIGSPSQGKVQDFLGVTPTMFPHVCSLCDFDVHSNMEWNQHTNCLRHAENRRQLLQMYPDWDPGMDPGMAPARSGNIRMSNTPNLAPGLLGQAPMGGGQQSERMSSGWGGNGGNAGSKNSRHGSVMDSRVVVAKYDVKPRTSKPLFALAEPFGILRENLVLKNKAFLEMDTHQQAQDMVQYYQQNRAMLCNQPVHFYLSKDLRVIRKDGQAASAKSLAGLQRKKQVVGAGSGSQVVYFSNVPKEEERMELLTIAGNFGTVEKYLFLQKEAFIQLSSAEDAEMMVKYYTLNPLTINGQRIKHNICTKYKILSPGNKVVDLRGRKNNSGNRRSPSPGNRSSSKSSSSKSSSKRQEQRKREESKSSVERDVKKSEETRSSAAKDKKKEETKSSAVKEDKKKDETKSSAVKEEKKKEETKSSAVKEEKKKDEESGEEVSGVVEGEEEQGKEEKQESEEKTDQDVELQNPEEDRDGDPVTTATNGEGDGAEAQEKETEPEAGPSEKAENTDDGDKKSTDPEDSQMNEEEDMATMEDFPDNMDDFVTLDELMDEDVEANKSLPDEDYIDNTRKGGMRVVNVGGFRKGYGFLDQILRLAKPFGKVVKHLVLDLRPEAYIQFATEEEAKAMVKFYNAGNIHAAVCDKNVKISHSQTYPTIQCGASQVVYLGQLPDTKYTDEAILKIAEPFGKVKKYFLNRIKRECFIEMENPATAEKMADKCKINPPKLYGKRLTVYVSRKYKHLKHGHRAMDVRSTEDRDRDRDSKKRDSRSRSSARTDEPPTKKSREEKTPTKDKKEDEGKGEEEVLKSEVEVEMKGAEDEVKEENTEEQKEVNADPDSNLEELGSDVVKQEEEEVCTSMNEHDHSMDLSANQTPTAEETDATAPMPANATTSLSADTTTPEQTDAATPVQADDSEPVQNDATTPIHPKPAPASLPLDPYDENNPVGMEFVKMGYYCRLCFLFYSNEETAKKIHCSSQTHYDKLKKHLEKNKKGKKTE